MDPSELWELELPSVLGVAVPRSWMLDDNLSVSFDSEFDSSEEARHEMAAIEADEDHDRLMARSTDSGSWMLSA